MKREGREIIYPSIPVTRGHKSHDALFVSDIVNTVQYDTVRYNVMCNGLTYLHLWVAEKPPSIAGVNRDRRPQCSVRHARGRQLQNSIVDCSLTGISLIERLGGNDRHN